MCAVNTSRTAPSRAARARPDGMNIEQLVNGVAAGLGFQTQATGPIVDIGLWESPQRGVPLYP
jgi:hypothetical protein